MAMRDLQRTEKNGPQSCNISKQEVKQSAFGILKTSLCDNNLTHRPPTSNISSEEGAGGRESCYYLYYHCQFLLLLLLLLLCCFYYYYTIIIHVVITFVIGSGLGEKKKINATTSEILQYSACGEANEYTNVKICNLCFFS